jgi:hypothetical protein
MKSFEPTLALCAWVLFSGAALGAGQDPSRAPAGNEKRPLILKMKRGSDTIGFSCLLSPARPGCTAKFEARAGQVAMLRGDRIGSMMLVFPSGNGTDELELGPYALPETGTYTLRLSYGASMMSRSESDPPARYNWTLRVK